MPNYFTRDNQEERKERTFKFYNSLKTTKPECDYGAKDCMTCTDKSCTMRQFLVNP